MAYIIDMNYTTGYRAGIDISKAKLTNVRKLVTKNKKCIEIEFDNNTYIQILDCKEYSMDEITMDEIIKNIPKKINDIIETYKSQHIDIGDFVKMIID